MPKPTPAPNPPVTLPPGWEPPIDIRQVAAMYGVSKSTVERWRRDPDQNLPKHHKIGPRLVRWYASAFAGWKPKP